MDKRLNEQVEATRAMNETLNKFLTIISNIEAAKSVTPPPLVSPPLVTTTLQASQPSRVKPGVPSNFDGDRAQGSAFLTSCECQGTLAAVPMRASIRVSALNKDGSGDPGTQSAVGCTA
jgi:hypothetical protein